jgi:hypothetical protein
MPSRKEYAEHIEKHVNKALHGIMWAMWDGDHAKRDKVIWRKLKPKHQKPFWNQKETEINNQTKISKFNG